MMIELISKQQAMNSLAALIEEKEKDEAYEALPELSSLYDAYGLVSNAEVLAVMEPVRIGNEEIHRD